MSDSEKPAKPQKKGFPWGGCIATLLVLGIVAVPLTMVLKGMGTMNNLVNVADRFFNETVMDAASKFQTGTITTTFMESIPEVTSTRGDVLEVATARSDEVFRRTDSLITMGVPRGTTVAEIRAPVTYRYHIKLSDEWRLAAKDNVCIVLAPEIRPSLPPAIHTDGVRKFVDRGWARFNGREALDHLESQLTPLVIQRASDEKHLRLAREDSRESVAEFVRNWLITEDQWRTDAFSKIVVVFPDEVTDQLAEQLEGVEAEPTIELE